MFYRYVTISATQALESDDLRHAMSPFSLLLSSFSGTQRILGYVRPRRIVAVHPPKTGKRRNIWRSLLMWTTFMRHCDVIVLQMLLRRMQTLNWVVSIDQLLLTMQTARGEILSCVAQTFEQLHHYKSFPQIKTLAEASITSCHGTSPSSPCALPPRLGGSCYCCVCVCVCVCVVGCFLTDTTIRDCYACLSPPLP